MEDVIGGSHDSTAPEARRRNYEENRRWRIGSRATWRCSTMTSRREAEREPRVRVAMSPAIRAVPAMQPKTSVSGVSGGTVLATGRPFLVITTGVRNLLTPSNTCRQCALNALANIVFTVSLVPL